MSHLTLAHARQLSAVLAPFYAAPAAPDLPARLACTLAGLLNVDTTCFDSIGSDGSLYHLGGNAPESFPPAQLTCMAARIREHTLFEPVVREGVNTPLKITDVSSAAAHERTDFYQDFYRPLHLVHQMTVLLPASGPRLTSCTLARRRDFTETERALLAFVQPHLSALFQLAALAARCGPTPSAVPEPTVAAGPAEVAATLGLTLREAVILAHLTQGRPDKEIAYYCRISPRTVQVHLRNIYAKLGVDNRTAAAVLGRDSGAS